MLCKIPGSHVGEYNTTSGILLSSLYILCILRISFLHFHFAQAWLFLLFKKSFWLERFQQKIFLKSNYSLSGITVLNAIRREGDDVLTVQMLCEYQALRPSIRHWYVMLGKYGGGAEMKASSVSGTNTPAFFPLLQYVGFCTPFRVAFLSTILPA